MEFDSIPLGMCRSDSTKGIFRRKTSSASIRSASRLAPPSTTSQSCPTSPRYSTRSQKGGKPVAHQEPEPSPSSSQRANSARLGSSSSSAALVGMSGSGGGVGGETSRNEAAALQRSASTVSNLKSGYNTQSGFCSYTGLFNTNKYAYNIISILMLIICFLMKIFINFFRFRSTIRPWISC